MTSLENTAFLAQFEERKLDHVRLALASQNQAEGYSGLNNIQLVHEAIPDLDFSEIQISTSLFNETQPTPFYISSMTAGHTNAIEINQVLAQACSTRGWIMGVGSQRRQLTDLHADKEWATLRTLAPKVKLMGNIGLSQLIATPLADLQRLVDSLEAFAMTIHTNPLQECLQPEGTPHFKGSYAAIEKVCAKLPVPVIIKETGCGFSTKTLTRLKNLGVAAVDVSGLGGTHWGRIEGERALKAPLRQQAALTFKNWGIPTVTALMNAKRIEPDYALFASGGVRSGLDAAKLLSLGANMVGIAKPMLAAALEGLPVLLKSMELFEFELKIALFCTGSLNIKALQENLTWQLIQ